MLEAMQAAGLVLYFQPTKIDFLGNGVRRVTWAGPRGDFDGLFTLSQVDIETYFKWIECGQFSAVFRDGSLVQISYDFDANSIVGHRLLYWPCPFRAESELSSGEPLADVLRDVSHKQTARCVSPVRFDYDPDRAGYLHPAAHLTLNNDECRVPMTRPLSLDDFLGFILRHFYSFDRAVSGLLVRRKGSRLAINMDDAFSEDIHIAVGS